MLEPDQTPLYRETQQFPLWLRLLVGASMDATMIITVVVLIKDRTTDIPTLAIAISCGIGVPIIIGCLLWFWRMETTVTRDHLSVRCIPFHLRPRTFSVTDIAESHARQYRPIIEYGGWGIRCGTPGKGRAYNVSGNQGVQLVFKDGRKLLIGSQSPQQLESALHSAATQSPCQP